MKKPSFILLLSMFLPSCNKSEAVLSLRVASIEMDYGNVKLSEVEKPGLIEDLDDYSAFMDYVCYASEDDEILYTDVSDEFKEVLLSSPLDTYLLAGQSGILSHNFTKGYDLSRIQDNQIGVFGSIGNYASKYYELNDSNHATIKYEYLRLLNNLDFKNEIKLADFPLFQDNRGFVKADNSEDLFYLISNGYFPYVEEEKLSSLFSKMLGVAGRFLDEGISDLDKYKGLYNYIVVENHYDYDSFNYKDSEHTDYECYFLEGVFNHHNAVCDGICKALVCLSRLVGLEAYHIGSSNGVSGHAYLYVNIDGVYYLSCPTNGSKISREGDIKYQTHTNSYFLTDYDTSDSEWDFFSPSYPSIIEKLKQVKPYDYYAEEAFVIDGVTYDYQIDSAGEGMDILNHVDEMAKESGIDLEIELALEINTYRELVDETKNLHFFTSDNGTFNGKLLKSFIFNHA